MVFICIIAVIVILLSIFMSNYITADRKDMLKENCYIIATISSQKSNLVINADENITLFRAISGVTEADLFITDTKGKVILCCCDD